MKNALRFIHDVFYLHLGTRGESQVAGLSLLSIMISSLKAVIQEGAASSAPLQLVERPPRHG